ncbi:MAG TPA: alpha/beta fold hydrolase [Anaerolineales bacterium]|nr:alpha/beta fold hydrolase [Anaerolineales bacterium]
MKRLISCGLAFLLLALLTAPALAQDNLPYVEPAECPIDVPGDREIDCGVLVTPENYDKPEGALVRLPYIYVHSTSPNPDPTPVLFTEGGPGYSSLPQVWGVGRSMIADERDVIIFEQRGNRYADPALMCSFEELAGFDHQSSPCLEQLLARGIDLTQYTTAVIAEDIESFRIAIGIEKWNLYGTSYSTRLMQWLMVNHPQGIRSVILQSVNLLHQTRFQHDPEHSLRVLKQMFADCAADPDCDRAFPNLETHFYETVASLNADPVELEITHSTDNSKLTYVVDGGRLIDWMVGSAFYGPTFPHYDTSYLPLLIDAAGRRDEDVLRLWAERNLENDLFLSDNFAYGVYFSVNCQDDAISVTEAQFLAQIAAVPELDGFARHFVEYQVCEIWGLPPAPSLAEGPIHSEIPTLVLAGSYDPITPPQWSKLAADNLANAFYLEFPSKGHNVDALTDCPMRIKTAFLRDPWTEPDTSCLAGEPPVGYVIPGEVIVMPGFSQSLDDVNFGEPQGNSFFEIVIGAATIVCILMVVFVLILDLIVFFSRKDLKRKWSRYNLSALMLAALAAGLSVAVVVFMSLLNQADVQFQRVTQIFGLPADYPYLMPLGLVVYLQIAVTIILIAVTFRIWRKVRGTIISRLLLALTSLAAVSFWPFYLRWDLTAILVPLLLK